FLRRYSRGSSPAATRDMNRSFSELMRRQTARSSIPPELPIKTCSRSARFLRASYGKASRCPKSGGRPPRLPPNSPRHSISPISAPPADAESSSEPEGASPGSESGAASPCLECRRTCYDAARRGPALRKFKLPARRGWIMKLKDRVAVVTGGASGMGQATVMRFLAEGACVVVADFNEETGKQTLAVASDRGFRDRIRFIRTDVAREADVEAMIALAVSQFGRLDIVFNNAGVGGALGPVWDVEVEEWDYTFDVLAKGVFLGIKHAARAMKPMGRGGSIINTASVAGLSGGSGPLVYSAAKAAVINLTRAAALQLAPDRIRVNAICPGGILTPLTHRGNPETVAKRLDHFQP